MTAGNDYEASPYTVSFDASQISAILMVSTVEDMVTELSEYFKVVITSTDQPDRVEIGSSNTSFITIEDNDPGNNHILTIAIHTTYVGNISKVVKLLINYIILHNFAAVQVSLAQQNHTVTEGDIVNITLHLSSRHEFDFTVTFQHMDGSATGESCPVVN